MTEYEHCCHCLYNLDLPQHEVLVAALHELVLDHDYPGNGIAELQERCCKLAGCLD